MVKSGKKARKPLDWLPEHLEFEGLAAEIETFVFDEGAQSQDLRPSCDEVVTLISTLWPNKKNLVNKAVKVYEQFHIAEKVATETPNKNGVTTDDRANSILLTIKSFLFDRIAKRVNAPETPDEDVVALDEMTNSLLIIIKIFSFDRLAKMMIATETLIKEVRQAMKYPRGNTMLRMVGKRDKMTRMCARVVTTLPTVRKILQLYALAIQRGYVDKELRARYKDDAPPLTFIGMYIDWCGPKVFKWTNKVCNEARTTVLEPPTEEEAAKIPAGADEAIAQFQYECGQLQRITKLIFNVRALGLIIHDPTLRPETVVPEDAAEAWNRLCGTTPAPAPAPAAAPSE